MAAMLPLPQIVFYLALLFLPQGVLSFTATVDHDTINWTREGEGWHVGREGQEGSVWTVKGAAVNAFRADDRNGTICERERGGRR